VTAVFLPLALHSWRGRRILALLCAVAFLDFIDPSITNVALSHILTAAAALIAPAATNTREDLNAAHGAEFEAGQPPAAVGPEPATKEI
jgi:hypothetical protein